MRYINDFKKLDKIQKMAKNGDKKAKEFLFNFMDLTDEQVNDYLSSIVVNDEEEIQEGFNNILEDLIKDENEAIDGYDKAIKYLSNFNPNSSFIERLNHIKEEEIEHIKELKEMLKDGNKN